MQAKCDAADDTTWHSRAGGGGTAQRGAAQHGAERSGEGSAGGASTCGTAGAGGAQHAPSTASHVSRSCLSRRGAVLRILVSARHTKSSMAAGWHRRGLQRGLGHAQGQRPARASAGSVTKRSGARAVCPLLVALQARHARTRSQPEFGNCTRTARLASGCGCGCPDPVRASSLTNPLPRVCTTHAHAVLLQYLLSPLLLGLRTRHNHTHGALGAHTVPATVPPLTRWRCRAARRSSLTESRPATFTWCTAARRTRCSTMRRHRAWCCSSRRRCAP